MLPRIRILVGGLALGLFGLLVASGPSAGQQPSRDKEIADIERRLQDLNKKLAALRGGSEESALAPAAETKLNPDWVKALHWRPLGPANMSGRITALSVCPTDSSTYWVATASGGLLKTENNGVTFEHQFDREATVSLGDVCVAPSDKNVVYVGSGENNPRNSVSWGDGVYRSADGGKTWKNVGLKRSFQIGKIVVHPTDPNTVYVGALGRLYGPGEERGVYKTTDGGNSWQKILYVDDKTGVQDMRMKPGDPNTLLVATWERQRDGFDGFFGDFEGDQYGPIKTHAPGSALYRTTDGGKTFTKLTAGLPTAKLGRIGLDWYPKDPNVVFALVDTEKAGMTTAPYLGLQGEEVDGGVKVSQAAENGPAAKAGLKADDVLVAVGGKAVKNNEEIANSLNNLVAGDKVKVTYKRGAETKDVEVTLGQRPPRPRAGGGQGGGGGGGLAGMLLAGFIGEDGEDGFKVARLLGEEATTAGLKEGDLVTAVDGKPAGSFRETFQNLSQSKKAGDKIKVTVDRAGKKQDIELALAPPAFGGGGGRGPSARRPFGSGLGGQAQNVQDEQGRDGFQTGGLFKSTDAGATWTRINSINPRPMYFSQIRVDPSDQTKLYVLGVSITVSTDGGKTFGPVARTGGGGGSGVHADQHALWIDPKDSRHMLIGCDGGTYVTYDRMANWDHLNHVALGQFYHVALDPRRPYKVYGGLQDNGSWGGPAETRSGGGRGFGGGGGANLTGAVNEDWISVGGGDGFICRVDPNDPDLVYSTSQNGSMSRRNLRTGETAAIRPRQSQGQGQARYRFNWNTPYILSNHNSRIFYAAGNVVFRSLDRGNNLEAISPEITLTSKGSATALSESPRNPNVLYAGTDDGGLWVTRDGAKTWSNITSNVGLKGPLWVATIEASRYEEGRCYAAFDGHRSDDDEPHAYVTEDFGKTWKSLRANLPTGSTRVLREDIKNPNVLYLGTEFAVWASLDRGYGWTKINANLPTVAVHELAQHPTAGEMVAATHGRSLWAVDVSALRQMTPQTLRAAAYLYAPTPVIRWRSEPSHGRTNRRFVAENPPSGAQLYVSLAAEAKETSLKVFDYEGKLVRELTVPKTPGLHRVSWDLGRTGGGRAAGAGAAAGAGGGGRRTGGQRQGAGAGTGAVTPRPAATGEAPQTEGQAAQTEGGPPPGAGFGFGGGARAVPPGQYRLVLTVDGKETTQTLRVEQDPAASAGDLIAGEEDDR